MTFAYDKSLSPMLWVLLALSAMELAVVHLLVALIWSGTIAAILSLLSVLGMIWIMATIRSFRCLPVLLDEARLLLRSGKLLSIEASLTNVAGVRRDVAAADLQRRDLLNLALLAHPNLIVDLRAPVEHRGKPINAVAHKLDDPSGFAAALIRAKAGAA